jgi:DNA adenine methylase
MKPINRAARTIFLNKTCFNGIYRVNAKGVFNVPFGDMNNPTLCERENLLECSKALKNTEILSEDYKALLPRVGEGDFVYLDPPYVPLSKTAHFTSYTRGGFGEEEQKELKEFCDDLDFRGARFLLNNSDTELVRDLYSSFKIVVIEARRSLVALVPSKLEIWIECPNCGLEAHNLGDLLDLFGTRVAKGKKIPQSWCRKCRSQRD